MLGAARAGFMGAAGTSAAAPYEDGLTVIAVPGTASQFSVKTSFTEAITTSVGGNPSYGGTNGIDFDGSGDKIRYLHSGDGFDIASSQDFVIQFEYILDETGPSGPFDTGINSNGIGMFGNNSSEYYLYGQPGKFAISWISSAAALTGTHLIQRSGSSITWKVNGVTKASATYSGAILSNQSSGSAITIGSHDSASTYPTYYEADAKIKNFQFRKGTASPLSTPFDVSVMATT
jgi:hypothetical protein